MSDAGKWELKMKTPMGEQKFSVDIRPEGDMSSPLFGSAKLDNVQVDGGSVSFSATVKSPMGEITLPFTGIIEGEQFSGTCKTPFGESTFTGAKV